MYSRVFVSVLAVVVAVIAGVIFYLRGPVVGSGGLQGAPALGGLAKAPDSRQMSSPLAVGMRTEGPQDPLVRHALESERGFGRSQKLERAGYELALKD